MALLILALLQRIFLMSSLMLLLGWLIFFMVLIKLLPILGTISGKTVKLMVMALICLGNNRQDKNPPNCMFSCLQILEVFLWFVLITLLNVTLIILTLSVSRLLNLLLRLVAFRLFLNAQCLAAISIGITVSFFFQAEDGIRDYKVTGVQTCALPILAPIASLQPEYNLLARDIEVSILPYVRDQRLGVIVYSPMASGLLTGAMTRARIASDRKSVV